MLAKLQIVAPTTFKVDGRVKLLRCSKVFNRYLEDYEDSNINAAFDSKGVFIDFETVNQNVCGLFPVALPKGYKYPCRICANEVTDKLDSSGFGLECSGCGMFFHNTCTSEPITPQLYRALAGSPSYIKILCPGCHLLHSSAELNLKRIDHKVQNVTKTIEAVKATVDNIGSSSYSDAAKKGPMVSLSRQIASNILKLTKESKDKEDAARLKRTRVVLKPGNTAIRRSSDIRKEFNKYFQGLIIRNCRVTAGGAIMLEFIDDAAAEKVDTEWSENHFGGNKGLKRPGESNTFGIIKYVYDDVSEEEIKDDIVKKFPGAECDFFKRKSDNTITINGVSKKKGSGVAIYIHNSLNAVEDTTRSIVSPDIETLFLSITNTPKPVTVGVVYRPPNGNMLLFLRNINR